MEIIKEENTVQLHSDLYDVGFLEDGKELSIMYAGVGDVFWMFHSENGMSSEDDMSFEISREKNYQLYKMFSCLYDNIISYNSESEEERIPIEGDRVKWYSDDGSIEKIQGVEWADSVEIIKEEGKVILNFEYRSRRVGMNGQVAVIRFRNSGSRYDYPYNGFLNQHYSDIQYLDDKEHQIDFEEFLFEQEHNK